MSTQPQTKPPVPFFVRKDVEFTRPANATAYTAGDAVAPVTLTITAASNASPIVVTSNAHGLTTEDRVTIAGVVGNTNANGTFQVKVITPNTFELHNEVTNAPIAGNAAWVSGGTIQKLLRLKDALTVAGGTGKIRAFRLTTNIATVTNGTFKVRIYNKAIAQIADNAPFTELYANRAAEQGESTFLIIATDGSGSDAATVETPGLNIPFQCDANRTDLFIQVIVTGAFTPGSGEQFRLETWIERDAQRGDF